MLWDGLDMKCLDGIKRVKVLLGKRLKVLIGKVGQSVLGTKIIV